MAIVHDIAVGLHPCSHLGDPVEKIGQYHVGAEALDQGGLAVAAAARAAAAFEADPFMRQFGERG